MQTTLQALEDERLREIVDGFVDAWERDRRRLQGRYRPRRVSSRASGPPLLPRTRARLGGSERRAAWRGCVVGLRRTLARRFGAARVGPRGRRVGPRVRCRCLGRARSTRTRGAVARVDREGRPRGRSRLGALAWAVARPP